MSTIVAPRSRARWQTGWSAFRIIAVGALFAMLAGPGFGAETATAKAPTTYYVAATGHVLAEPFLSDWIARDGLNALGLPVTEPTVRDGKTAQYFEFGYLQTAAKATGTAQLVERPSGGELLDALHTPDRTVAGRRVGGSRSVSAFRSPNGSTEHVVTGRFKAFYDQNGGSKRFGQPLSDAYDAFGEDVQWFEFGRLQSSLTDQQVEVAPVGYELARARGIDTFPVERGTLPAFSAKRFRAYHGDGTVPEAAGPFTPVRIEIPKIKIDATVEKVGIVDGVMGVPKNAWNVGWYPAIAKPGERTNVVMAGHKDWWGIGPTVFWNLGLLSPGDKIYLVGKSGKGSTYMVTKVWEIDANTDANVVIGDAGDETLTLITCGGTFDGAEYLSRQIVRAERI